MTTVVSRSRLSVSRSLADQLAPVLELYEELRSSWPVHVDVSEARMRVHAGRPALDAGHLLESAGELAWPVSRAITAFERAGVATTSEVYALSNTGFDSSALLVAWLNGDPVPKASPQRLARRAAGLVGSALLRAAADRLAAVLAEAQRELNCCPCCGGAPDLALVDARRRWLVCARCDTLWEAAIGGCLGCGADAPPGLVRVRSPYLGYTLVVCNACGRYVKERSAGGKCVPMVERELTALLDEAAADRGFRI